MVKPKLLKCPLVAACWILATGFLAPLALAKTTASLDRDQIHANETARLIIETDNVDSGVEPDLSVLGNNFRILGTSSSRNVSIVNGQQTALHRWISEIEPLSAGSFTIPALNVGGEQTGVLRLKVLPESAQQDIGDRDIQVRTEVSPEQVYVQQQLILTIKLYLKVKILNGNLSDPEIANTKIVRMGNDVQYDATIDGQPYRVIERKYALFPERSGKLEIPPIHFVGSVEDRSGSSVFGSIFNQGKRIRVKSGRLEVSVLPQDSGFKGAYWLPAKNLEISESSAFETETSVGQPMTRSIEITARGLSGEQLPEIELPPSNSFTQYPEETRYQTSVENGNIVGVASRSVAIIPGQVGTLVLPELKLNWWNTQTDSLETAILPAREIDVIADSSTPSALSGGGEPELPASRTSQTSGLADRQPDPAAPDFWKWLALLLGAGWLISTGWLWRRLGAPNKRHDSEATPDKPLPAAACLRRLKHACRTNDAINARCALQDWARAQWPTSGIWSLSDIAERCGHTELAREIVELDRFLYGIPDTERFSDKCWQGRALLQAINEFDQTRSPDKTSLSLPELYPRGPTASGH